VPSKGPCVAAVQTLDYTGAGTLFWSVSLTPLRPAALRRPP